MHIAVVGAGSRFTYSLLRSIYQAQVAAEVHLALMDTRPAALAEFPVVVARLNRLTGRRVTVSLPSERRPALHGADHVLAAYAINFPDAFLRTCHVMRNHGIDFVEGETATPGALMATLRHLPLLVEITQEVQQVAPHAWVHVINNPMPRLLYGAMQATGYTRIMGHCHGTLGMRARVAMLTATEPEEIDFFVAGINHFHLVQRARHRPTGRDLLAELVDLPPEKVAVWQAHSFTEWKMFEELGYLIGHGIWHNYDYIPFAARRLFRHSFYNTWDRACLGVHAVREDRTRAGISHEHATRLEDDAQAQAFLAAPNNEPLFDIMTALAGLRAPYFYLSGNAPNQGHIPGLPEGAIVELPAWVHPDRLELLPAPAPLPEFFLAMLRTHLSIFELSVTAALRHSRQAAIEAVAIDPAFRGCDCSPRQLVEEMLAANAGLVPVLC